MRIYNEHDSCVYTVAAAEAGDQTLTLRLSGSAVFAGRIKIHSVDSGNHAIRTDTLIPYPFNPLGISLVTEDLTRVVPIVAAGGGAICVVEGANISPFLPPSGIPFDQR